MYHKVGPQALLLVRVTKQASRVGGLAKKLLFLVICPVSGIHQLLTLLMTSSLNVSPALKQQRIFDRKTI